LKGVSTLKNATNSTTLYEPSQSDTSNGKDVDELLSAHSSIHLSDNADHSDSSFTASSSSHFDQAQQAKDSERENNNNDKKQASLFEGSFRVFNESVNDDELAQLDINKCNIADDSDDSESSM